MTKRIYLDNAATTPTDKRVISAMLPYLDKIYANAGALHEDGVRAKKALHDAREKVARALEVRTEEIIFTSGGTESDNIAIQGVVIAARAGGIRYPHIVTTAFEHPAVLETCKIMENYGVKVSYVKPDKNGIISAEKIKKAITKDTILVSVMQVQSEIGTIQPIREISRVVKEIRGKKNSQYPVFHTDACQAVNYLDASPNHLGVDLLTLTGSKIYGPKGSGMLFIKHGTPIAPIMRGGDQENGLRPGTEPVYLSVGFAEALDIAVKMRKKEAIRLTGIRDYFIAKLLSLDKRIKINGDKEKRVANNVNMGIDGIDNEFFVIQLSEEGVSASTKSACRTNDDSGSHVILAIGGSEKEAKETVRFSLGRSTTKKEIDRTISALKKLLKTKN